MVFCVVFSLVTLTACAPVSPTAPSRDVSPESVVATTTPDPAPTPEPEPEPIPTPAAQPRSLTCADAQVEIYDGPDPDKAHARITVPAGEWAAPTRFELLAYPLPLTDPADVDSSGTWPVRPGTTEEFRTDKPSRGPHQVDVRCNDEVIASRTHS